MKTYKAIYKGGLKRISFVAQPAIEENFIYFSSEKEIIFTFANEEKREILTPVLIPNKEIYRKGNDKVQEFNIVFDEETISNVFKDVASGNIAFNLEHTNTEFDGIDILNSFLSNKELGINPIGFEHLPNGTLFSLLKINNDDVWQSVKNGTFKGVSVEIPLDLEEENEQIKFNKDLLNIVRKCH